jgi:poly(hydroxyalkanoate) depolymerase family esterase
LPIVIILLCVAALALVGGALAVRRARRGLPRVEAGQFLARSYTNAQGTRSYKVFLPPGHERAGPVPLMVMLHGCAQDADDCARGSRLNELAAADTFVVIYPEQSAAANRQRCWNWFLPAHQVRDSGEPSLIAGITRQIMAEVAVDPRRVYVAGLSAGAAMAVVMGTTYPDLYAAVVSHSGLPYRAARSALEAFRAMKQGGRDSHRQGVLAHRAMGEHARVVPVMVIHGAADPVANVANAYQTIAQWLAANHLSNGGADGDGASDLLARVHQGQSPAGYHYTRKVYVDDRGRGILEQWIIEELGHAFSGGAREGTFTDARGPDISREIVRFFLEHPKVDERSQAGG